MNKKIIVRICKIFEDELFSKTEDFSVDNYNRFDDKIWKLKEEFGLESSPFLFLPDPAEEADFFMMAASMDGFTEPSREDTEKYLSMMQQSYNKLKKLIEIK